MRGCGGGCEGQGFAAHLLAAIRSFGFGCGSVMRRVLPDGGRAGDSGRITPTWLGPSTAAGPTLSIRSGNLWRQVGPCRIGPFMTTCSAEMRYTLSITAGSLKVPESRVNAGLMLQGLSGRAFQRAISREKALQARTENTGYGLAKLIGGATQTTSCSRNIFPYWTEQEYCDKTGINSPGEWSVP
jgi:hypothetical protein